MGHTYMLYLRLRMPNPPSLVENVVLFRTYLRAPGQKEMELAHTQDLGKHW